MSPQIVAKLTALVLAGTGVILAATACLILLAVGRRRQRSKYFERLDQLRETYGPLIRGALRQERHYASVLDDLAGITGPERIYMLERLCFEQSSTAEQVPVLRKLCEDLGLVQVWQRQLSGLNRARFRQLFSSQGDVVERIEPLSFLARARSAENLRLIRHQPSWPLLVQALDDADVDVRAVAARALAAIAEAQSFPALVECLHRAVLNLAKGLSVRSARAALVSFPLSFAVELLPSLRHPHPRIRFLATEIVRDMVEREAAGKPEFDLISDVFPPALAEVFLSELAIDSNPDVRARAAPVIALLQDVRAVPTLLALLNDPKWFVRLHAVRGAARSRHTLELRNLVERMTDSNWRVREAAAQALVKLGQFDLLIDHLIHSDDRYSREQVAEELERAGMMSAVLARYAQGVDSRERRVIEQLGRMGKTSYILAFLQNGAPLGMRHRLMRDFAAHREPEVRAWAQRLAHA